MKSFSTAALPLILALSAVAVPAAAEDLLQVYDLAKENDPLFREAAANRDANKQARPQAISAMLPQLTASASTGRTWSDGTSSRDQLINGEIVTIDSGGTSKSDADAWGLSLRQSIFSYANWSSVRQANHVVAQAEVDYQAAEQNLAQRVAQQYFIVLSALDDVEALESAREAISRQLDQTERRFEVGLIAITDVQEARAGRDQAAAAVINAKRVLSSALEQLRATIGLKPEILKKPDETLPLLSPDPLDEEAWVKASMDQNATLNSSRLAADIARDAVQGSISGYLPTIDLVAGRNFNSNDGRSQLITGEFGGNEANNYGKNVGIQVQMPLFTGGATTSRVKQSQYRWIAAKERLERTSRSTEQLARDSYLGVNSEISRVQALRASVASNETALKAAEAGYEVGTRTTVDVLNARRNLIQSQSNYSQARYQYLNNVVQLRLASGELDRTTLEEINRWLLVDAPVAGTARAPTPVAPPTAPPAAQPPPAN